MRPPWVQFLGYGGLIKTSARLSIVIACVLGFLLFSAELCWALTTEFYSESTYVPQYGILSDTQVRLAPYKSESLISYVGFALQRQDKTRPSQTQLYSEDILMASAGLRVSLNKYFSALAEFRTEDRSRLGLLAGQIWEYFFHDRTFFTDFYGESLVLPSFHNDPVTTLWIKQGLRFRISSLWILDPFVEVYFRQSPDPELGRDTEQLRAGLRGFYIQDKWNASLLIYQSFPKDERPHEEVLLTLGGAF